MSAIVPEPGEERKWYYLALRHLRMASRLLRAGFAAGTAFHTYHAYECALSTVIAANGYPVPPEGWERLHLPSGQSIQAYPSPQGGVLDKNAHKARIVFFDQLTEQSKPYRATHDLLKTFLTYDDRLDSLYYNVVRDHLPEQRYQTVFTGDLFTIVLRFVLEIRVEVPKAPIHDA